MSSRPAPRLRTIFACTSCGSTVPKWAGRCAACGEWNSLVEEVEMPAPPAAVAAVATLPVRITEVSTASVAAVSTGIGELDRVLGGGIVAGSVTLLGGEPGIGKSTLLMQLAGSWPGTVLYVSAEESAAQVHGRAARLGALREDVWLFAETSLPAILGAIDDTDPALVVVDSIQTIHDPELSSPPGSVGQVRHGAHRLVELAKRRGVPVVLVGHVTKDGGLAGPRVLEHVVDTVIQFEGDRSHALRLLRAAKHRFGPTNDLGVFEMRGDGLVGVPDASALFLSDRQAGVAGSAVVPTIEGRRPITVEVQALASPAPDGVPARRSAQGLDGGRLSMLCAVLGRRAGLGVDRVDVWASAAGGTRVAEPGLDLGVALAIAGALSDVPLPGGLVAVGEVGLAGEVRQVPHLPRRLEEAQRLGFTAAVVPASASERDCGGVDLDLLRAGTLVDAFDLVGVRRPRRSGADPAARTLRSGGK